MSILDFKNGTETVIGLRGRPIQGRDARHYDVTRSLVGAVQIRNGSAPASYDYGTRVCSHPDGAYHSCAYVSARNRIVPVAYAAAFEASRALPVPDAAIPRLFFAKMDELWRDRP